MKHFSQTTFLVAVAVGVIQSPSQALVIVHFDPSGQTVNIGDTFNVQIYADMTEPIVGWGMVFAIEHPEVVALNGPPAAAAPWLDTTVPHGDNWLLGGLAFPNPITGSNILLATLNFTALAFGETDLLLTIDRHSLRQGFAMGPPAPVGTFDSVSLNIGHVNVVPAPGVLAWLGLAGLGFRRRRRKN